NSNLATIDDFGNITTNENSETGNVIVTIVLTNDDGTVVTDSISIEIGNIITDQTANIGDDVRFTIAPGVVPEDTDQVIRYEWYDAETGDLISTDKDLILDNVTMDDDSKQF